MAVAGGRGGAGAGRPLAASKARVSPIAYTCAANTRVPRRVGWRDRAYSLFVRHFVVTFSASAGEISSVYYFSFSLFVFIDPK